MGGRRVVRAGTRGSKLALWQTEFVIERLSQHWSNIDFRITQVRSRGDRDQSTPLPVIGGKGLFTAELEAGLHNGTIDLAIHSLKDMPIEDPEGLKTAAILAREDPRDVLISRNGVHLDELPANAVIGTSSIRRGAQILARRPDLQVRSIRGNVDTRLRKLDAGQFDAIVLAGAGVKRMGLAARVSQWLPVEWFTPAPGQGALAVQCRADDVAVLELLAAIDDPHLAALVHAERQFLAELGGGCSEPVGALARPALAGTGTDSTPVDALELHVWYSRPDGQQFYNVPAVVAEWADLAHSARAAARTAQSAVHSHSSEIVTFETAPRVLLTRSMTADWSECRALLAAGMQPVVAPMIDIAPELTPAELQTRMGDPQQYDWLIFTSANAVRVLAELLVAADISASAFDGVRVAAVGPHTGDAAMRYGFNVTLIPATFSAEGLSEASADFAGQRVLLPRSALGDPGLVESLTQLGAHVNEISLYRPRPRRLDGHAIAAMQTGVDMLTFASPSAVRALHDEIAHFPELGELLQAAPIACIGPKTAEAVAQLGLTPAIVSEVHTMQALIDAIGDYFQERKSRAAATGTVRTEEAS